MIVYNATKAQFDDDVNFNRISDIILHNLREKKLPGGQLAEYHSWQNSLHFMRAVIDDPDISADVEVAVEYQIPRTSKRVDFMIAGADKDDNSNVVVVELKQWDKAEKVDDIMLHSVRAFTGGAYRIVNHPSYQAYAYATFIKNSSEQVQDDHIGIWPCAYLHNCDSVTREPLDDEIYRVWYEEAPLFDKTQAWNLRKFIKQFISKKSSSGDLLYSEDNGQGLFLQLVPDENSGETIVRTNPGLDTAVDTENDPTYVLNTNTMRFHYPYCNSVQDIKEKNKEFFYGTREDAIEQGYKPCGVCNP